MTDRRLRLSFSVLLLALAVTAVRPGHAQQAPFNHGGFNLVPVSRGASDVGDIDDDGDLDLIVAGNENASRGETTKLYENVDDGAFAEVDADLAGVDSGTTDFFDADGDGDLDLLVTGYQGATLYENDGSGNFSEAGDAGIESRRQSAVAIGDIDGDGAPDLVLAGLDGSRKPSTTLYENDGDGTFSAVGDAGLTDVDPAGLDVADVDDDGDLDLILTGEDENDNDTATLYENQGDGSFVEAGESFESPSRAGSARFADVNGDGAPDLVLADQSSVLDATTLYENDGEGSFSEDRYAGIDDVNGQVGFADVDLDGDLDLVNTGDPGSSDPGVTFYENDGQGNFSVLESNIVGVSGASLSIGDVDGDNDPDLLLTGEDPFFDASTRLYVDRTNQEPPNRAPLLGRSPSPPGTTAAGLVASTTVEIGDRDGDAVSLSLTQDESDAGASFSDEGGGLGTFEFSPNRNDAGTEVPFTVEASDGEGETASVSFSVSVPDVFAAADAGLTPLSSSSSDFGDVNGNGTQELVVTGNSNTRQALLYEYDGQGGYAPMEAGFDGVFGGSSDFADIDNDGDLDLLVTGAGRYKSPTATLYENDGQGNFSELNTDIDGVWNGTDAAFGDVDDDGDLDLVVIGTDDNRDKTSTLYLNDGTGSFSKAGESLEGVGMGAAKFEDVDDDGDLDLLLVGAYGGATATIYENDGTGSFSDMGAGLDGAQRSSAAFGDVEGDGDSDLVIAGGVSRSPSISLYTNDGDGTFTKRSIGAAPLDRAAVEFGDVDDDGDPDLLAAGENEDGESVMTVYENDGAGHFSDLGAGLSVGAAGGAVSIGDANGDGNYDVAVTGDRAGDISAGDPKRGGTTLYEPLRADAVSASASTSVGADGSADFGDTGVNIDFTGTSGSGSVLVKKLDTRPRGTRGIPEDNVSTYRFVIGAGGGLTFDEAAVRFDTGTLAGASDASNVTVYSRPVQAEGSFTELPTSVESGDVVATANSFSEFVLASDSEPLPVEMAGFEGAFTEGGVRLTWQTASEENNAGFEVQRKAAGDPKAAWTEVGFVESKASNGTTNEPRSYRFEDGEVPFGADMVEYRLRQVDTDGRSALTDPVQVERTVRQLRLQRPLPNPAREQVTVRFAVPERQEAALRLYDVMGREVRTLARGPQEGRTEMRVGLSDLSSGIYFLRLQAGGTTKTKKMTVVR